VRMRTLCVGGLVCLVCGCVSPRRTVERAFAVADDIVRRTAEQDESLSSEPRPVTNVTDLVQGIVSRDVDFRRHVSAIAAKGVDVHQAASARWPRLGVGGDVEYPADDEDTDPQDWTSAGLRVRYDIMSALFAGDARWAAELAVAREAQRARAYAAGVGFGALQRVLHLKSMAMRGRVAGEALAFAREGVERARIASTEMQVAEWEERVHRWALQERRFKADIADGWSELESACGRPLDREAVTRQAADLCPTGGLSRTELAEIWIERPDVQAAKLAYCLAELGVVDAKRHGWPRFSASLGLGTFYLDADNDSVPVLPSVSMSLPLLDMGDTRRRVSKARIEADLAERLLHDTVHRLSQERARAAAVHQDARKAAEDAAQRLQGIDERGRRLAVAVAEGSADRDAVLRLAIRRCEALIELGEAQARVRAAAVREEQRAGVLYADWMRPGVERALRDALPKPMLDTGMRP